VCIDPKLTATASFADYIIAPKLHVERDDATLLVDMFYEGAYSHYAPAAIEPGFDAIEEWEVYLGLAQRMGIDVSLPTGQIDLSKMPTKFELLSLLTKGSRVPIEEVRSKDGGHLFEEIEVRVDPPMAGLEARLQLAPEGIPEELAAVRAEPVTPLGQYGEDGSYTHLLICRRMREVMNSVGRDFPDSRAKRPTNPVYLCPEDLAAIGCADGDSIEIESESDRISAVAESDSSLQPGVIALAHSWGDVPGRDSDGNADPGSSVARLIAVDQHFDPLTGMARQSAIPVKLHSTASA